MDVLDGFTILTSIRFEHNSYCIILHLLIYGPVKCHSLFFYSIELRQDLLNKNKQLGSILEDLFPFAQAMRCLREAMFVRLP